MATIDDDLGAFDSALSVLPHAPRATVYPIIF